MKKFGLFLTVGFLMVTTGASAQFASAGAGTDQTLSERPKRSLLKETRDYSRIHASYTPLKLTLDVEGAEDVKLNGVSVGYTHGFNIVRELPLFVEFGVNGSYAATTLDYEDLGLSSDTFEEKLYVVSLNVPVSLAYKLSFSKQTSLTPFVGVNFRGMLLGKGKYAITDQTWLDQMHEDGFSDSEIWEEVEAKYSLKQEMNLFDKGDMGGKNAAWKRLQVGWQIGVGLNYKHLYVGLAYGEDFSELYKKCKVAFTTVSLGYNF